jgi:quercetin dioxygenase-like cupin family protein
MNFDTGVSGAYRLTAHETVTVRVSTPYLLEAEVHYEPGRLPPAHVHPDQDERFEILEGSLRVVIGGAERIVHAGEVLEIPRGVPHKMTGSGDAPTRAIWQTRPALRTEEWWAALAAARDECGDGDPPLRALAPLLRRHAPEFQLALPRAIQRPLLWLLAAMPRRKSRAPNVTGSRSA